MGRRRRTAAAFLAAALVAALAACTDGGPRYGVTPVPLEDLPAAPPGTEQSDEDLARSRLLALEDMPADGFVMVPASQEDDSDDTGGVCVFDYDDRITPDHVVWEASVTFMNQGLATMVHEWVGVVPEGISLTNDVLADLQLCDGPAQGTDGASTVTVTSTPSIVELPSTPTLGCRDAQLLIDGKPALGTFCIGAQIDRVVTLAVVTVGPLPVLDEPEIIALLGPAMAKALA